jgi:putative membrane protein
VSTAPDLRILQANERTALAWLRTGLAVMAFGFVVARIGIWLNAESGDGRGTAGVWPVAVGIAFIVLGAAAHVMTALRFVRVQKAIVEGRPIIPGTRAVVVFAIGLIVLSAIVVAYLVTLQR